MKPIDVKKALPYVAIIALFALITLAFLNPVLDGKRLKQSDITQHIGMSKEIADYRTQTGKEALWTNSMFGGMPAYQISVLYKNNLIKYADKLFTLGLPHPANYVFLYFLGFFILMLVLRVNPWVALIGSIGFAFSSYFLIIIEAGHNSKAHAIGYMAPVLAGIILTYRGKYIWGALMTALFLSLQLAANHLQITYYLLLTVLIFGIVELIHSIRTKTLVSFGKATVLLAVAALLAVGTNITSMWATSQYGKDTIRGASELTANRANQTGGLDRDYATQWSYGIGETFSLMIPNVKGGATGALAENPKSLEGMQPQLAQAVGQQNHYWGDQPFTSGPVYAGAVMVFLFILGLFIVKSNARWWLLAATLLSILLAWGHNFMAFTNFFMDVIPGYNKFRAVSMTLVIAELTIPILATLALDTLFRNPGLIRLKWKEMILSLALTAGLALIMYVMPKTFFSFYSSGEVQAIAEQRTTIDQANTAQFNEYVSGMETARVSIFKRDALRSFLFILAAAAVIWLVERMKMSRWVWIGALAVIVGLDMIPVANRYLHKELFVTRSAARNPFVASDADKIILKDTDPNFRVLNLTVNTFNDASTSYFHKSIGGYHGAKLRRYQELIDNHILKNNEHVINMLNTKYYIAPDQATGAPRVELNMAAFGHAWFVNDIEWVNNADEELNALNLYNPRVTAIVDKRFSSVLADFNPAIDSTGTITLLEYKPNYLKYNTSAANDQLAVFSEIYYADGWNAFIDGKPVPHVRADYVLRALKVPAGNHTIEFKFEPKVYYAGEKISLISSILLILLAAGYLFHTLRNCRRPNTV